MRKILVVVDIQNDFVDGALGTVEAQNIIKNCVDKIKNFDGEIFVTYDTHFENYMETSEGKNLPVRHCIKGTDGWELNKSIKDELKQKKYTEVEKYSFGSLDLPEMIGDGEKQIELIGLCTDICVVSNALILKAAFPESEIIVDESCCAGVTPTLHAAALETMKSCQIKIRGDKNV